MNEGLPAGTPGPHVFVDSIDDPIVGSDDLAHLTRALRMRDDEPLTVSDGDGRWCRARFATDGRIRLDGEVVSVAPRPDPLTIAFSLVKGQKPELVIQKLTELGIDEIVVLVADRSVVKWDETKVERAFERWHRISREASMQSHRVRLPRLSGPLRAVEWLAKGDVAAAHFGGGSIGPSHRSIAIGPEGGWSPEEIGVASQTVSLGDTVLRAETAAISAATLLSAAAGSERADVR